MIHDFFRIPSSCVVLVMIGALTGLQSHWSRAGEPQQEPVPLIFDTDICGDCDDVLALGMIHALQSRGLCRLWPSRSASITSWPPRSSTRSTRFTSRGDIPIGVVGKGGVIEKSEYPVAGRGEGRRPTSAILTT